MVAERLLNNGTSIREYSIALKTCALKYCNYDMDKSARGEIITKGLSTRVIVYAGTDVKYMKAIYEAQKKKLEELDLIRAAEFESKFTIVTAYIKLCGVKLDEDKWKAKMKSDQTNRDLAEKVCNDWILDFYKQHNGENSYIEYPFLVDSTFVHPGDSTELKFKEIPKDAIIVGQRTEKSDKYGTLFYTICKIPFGWFNKSNTFHPFIETVNAVQLDLFSNTEVEFGDKCILNWSSSAQVIPVLELLGCKLEVFDKKEKRIKKSVDQNILESQREISPLVSLYLEYKNWDTVCNAFGEKFLKARSKDGRIRGDWRSIGTDTLRMSCSGQVHGQRINLQQLPADEVTRSCFIAEKGNSWVSIDMAGQQYNYKFLTIINIQYIYKNLYKNAHFYLKRKKLKFGPILEKSNM